MRTKYPLHVNTAELAALLAGGDDYIRTKNNVVLGLALNPKLNPDAPEAVVFGRGSRVVARAERFLAANSAVPTYIKCAVNSWRFAGLHRAVRISRTAPDIATYGRFRKPGSVHGVIFLERIDTNDLDLVAGGFPNASTRKAVEAAAIKFVRSRLLRQDYDVSDHQRDNLGYDLRATKRGEELLVEVKGTDLPIPRFFISRNEVACSRREPGWRLYIVTQARDKPRCHVYTEEQMSRSFRFDSLTWLCTKGAA